MIKDVCKEILKISETHDDNLCTTFADILEELNISAVLCNNQSVSVVFNTTLQKHFLLNEFQKLIKKNDIENRVAAQDMIIFQNQTEEQTSDVSKYIR